MPRGAASLSQSAHSRHCMHSADNGVTPWLSDGACRGKSSEVLTGGTLKHNERQRFIGEIVVHLVSDQRKLCSGAFCREFEPPGEQLNDDMDVPTMTGLRIRRQSPGFRGRLTRFIELVSPHMERCFVNAHGSRRRLMPQRSGLGAIGRTDRRTCAPPPTGTAMLCPMRAAQRNQCGVPNEQ